MWILKMISRSDADELMRRLRKAADHPERLGASAAKAIFWQAANQLEELIIGHLRYEKVRRLNPRQWQEAWDICLQTGKRFDDFVDELND